MRAHPAGPEDRAAMDHLGMVDQVQESVVGVHGLLILQARGLQDHGHLGGERLDVLQRHGLAGPAALGALMHHGPPGLGALLARPLHL